MLRLTTAMKFWWQLTSPRTPERVAAEAYRSLSYRGRHRFVEPAPVLPEPDVWRTLRLGWQAYVQPIPIVEVFR